MKQIHLILFACLCLQSSVLSKKSTIQDKQNPKLSWTGKAAFNAYSLTGAIDIKNVTSRVTINKLEDLYIEIDMTSLDHENSDLKTHLRSKDFFEVKRYKSASFQLSKPAKIVNGEALITGTLNIKDISKEEQFKVKIVDNQLILDIVINRTDYGITFNSPTFFEKMKDQAIADEFRLEGEIQL
ncbi:MAG: YceI family protein [Bacteroidota bacterium]